MELTKRKLKLTCVYFLWKVKDVGQVGELSQTCALLDHWHSLGKEIDNGSALARRKDSKFENMSHHIWYFPWIEQIGVLSILKQLQ